MTVNTGKVVLRPLIAVFIVLLLFIAVSGFYRGWVFYMLFGCGGVLLFWMGYRFRLWHLKNRKQELEEMVSRRTDQL